MRLVAVEGKRMFNEGLTRCISVAGAAKKEPQTAALES